MAETLVMLSTKDNEFDPFSQFDIWRERDVELGHYCNEIMGKIAFTSTRLSEPLNNEEVNRAIDNFIAHDMTKNFVKVTKEIEPEILDEKYGLENNNSEDEDG